MKQQVIRRALGFLMSGLMLSISLSVVTSPAQASACKTLKQVKVVSGIKYTCKQVGNKRQWVAQNNNSKSVVKPASSPTPRPTTKAPTPLPPEESPCSRPGQTVGSGAAKLVCVKFNGTLNWIRSARLDSPYPFEPCRTVGQIATWEGERLQCLEGDFGKLWDIMGDDPNWGLSYRTFIFTDLTPVQLPATGTRPISSGRLNRNIDFNWGFDRILDAGSDLVLVNLSGCLASDRSSQIQVRLDADDGARLMIDGEQVSIDATDWRDKVGPGAPTFSRQFFANSPRTFDLWIYERFGAAHAKLEWNVGGFWATVPLSAFRCE